MTNALRSDLKSSAGLDPYDLVERIAEANPSADITHIQRLVRRALLGPDSEYTDCFVDYATERLMRRYLAREAEKVTTTLKPGTSSEKFVRTNPAPVPAPRTYTPVAPPAPRPVAPRPEPEPPAQIRSVVIPERPAPRSEPLPALRVTPPAPARPGQSKMRTPAPEIRDLHAKRARAFLVGSLLKQQAPNGKPLGECTLRECEQFGTWYRGIRASAPKHAPLDATVSLYFDDEKLRKIQTWTSDVYAD